MDHFKGGRPLPLKACRRVNALAGIPLGLLHPSGNRLGGRLELTRQLFGRASRSHQIDHLSPERRRISGSISRHQTPQKSISRVSTKSGQLQSGASLLGIVGIQSVSAADQGNFSPATAIASNDTGPTRHFPAVRI
jgi:hypothetical protein